MEREALLAALARVIAPSGCETAAAQYLLEKLAGIYDETWTDGAGNLIFKISSGENCGKGRLMPLRADMHRLRSFWATLRREGYLLACKT